jgi:hypothetical protein
LEAIKFNPSNSFIPIKPKGISKVVCSILEQTTIDHFFNKKSNATMGVTTEVNTEVATEVKKLILNCKSERTSSQLQQLLGQNKITKSSELPENAVIRKFRITANDDCSRKAYIKPSIEQGLLEMTIPDKLNSRNQKCRLTEKGIVFKNEL